MCCLRDNSVCVEKIRPAPRLRNGGGCSQNFVKSFRVALTKSPVREGAPKAQSRYMLDFSCSPVTRRAPELTDCGTGIIFFVRSRFSPTTLAVPRTVLKELVPS